MAFQNKLILIQSTAFKIQVYIIRYGQLNMNHKMKLVIWVLLILATCSQSNIGQNRQNQIAIESSNWLTLVENDIQTAHFQIRPVSFKVIRPYQIPQQKIKKYSWPKPQPKFCLFHDLKPPPILESATGQQRAKLVHTKYGFNIYVDSKDSLVSLIIANTGTWQPENINLIGHIVKEGDYVLNLGSHIGLQAIVMGKIIGPTGKLFIFQPYSSSYNILSKNIELNNLTKITKAYNMGASDKKSKSSIRIDYYNTGGMQIQQDTKQLQNSAQMQNVQTDLVDNILPPGTKLDFALIDVQRMQVKALNGMRKIIQASPNLVIMSQWQYGLNLKRDKQKTLDLLKWLDGLGYKAYQYLGGDAFNCDVGNFKQFPDMLQLASDIFYFNDVFFFPSTVPLP